MKHVAQQFITAAAGALVVGALAAPVGAQAQTPPRCSAGQIRVTNAGEQAAAGHRRVVLMFSLTDGASPCTLTGYPGVVTGAGGPAIQADWTLSGYMGGVQTPDLPVVVVSASEPAYALVEGAVTDSGDPDRPCPTYTELMVITPDTPDAVVVAADIQSCSLQVHPISSHP